jgi:branched-chain amino acid transport system ATP-binding protein
MSDALLQLTHVHAGYGRIPVLRDITMRIAPGESVGILGANGAGKTTLLRTITGTTSVSQGSVALGGRDITKVTSWRRSRAGLGHVPDGRHVFGAMTVLENLKVAARKDVKKTVDSVLDVFPLLRPCLAQDAGTLSGGQQQMVAVGRALMGKPKIILIDEMSAGLAPIVAKELVDSLAALRSMGMGIVLVEQSPELISAAIERAYLLENGSLVAEGTLDEMGGAGAIAERYLGMGKTTAATAASPSER